MHFTVGLPILISYCSTKWLPELQWKIYMKWRDFYWQSAHKITPTPFFPQPPTQSSFHLFITLSLGVCCEVNTAVCLSSYIPAAWQWSVLFVFYLCLFLSCVQYTLVKLSLQKQFQNWVLTLLSWYPGQTLPIPYMSSIPLSIYTCIFVFWHFNS